MDWSRRAWVGGLAIGVVSIAGCIDNVANSLGEEGSSSPYSVSIDRIEEETVLDRFQTAELAGQPASVRDVVQAAIADRYETDAIDDSVAAFLADNEFVRADGAYYALDAEVPQEVLVLTPVDGADIDPDAVVRSRNYWAEVGRTGVIDTAVSTGEARRPRLPETLYDFVAEYEYVTLGDPADADASIYEWQIETDDRGGPPYWIDASAVDRTDVFGDDVVDIESLSADARAEIETARDEGRVGFDSPPEVTDLSSSYVRIDGAYYLVSVGVAN